MVLAGIFVVLGIALLIGGGQGGIIFGIIFLIIGVIRFFTKIGSSRSGRNNDWIPCPSCGKTTSRLVISTHGCQECGYKN